jgi:SagB-type dehydrogenase family enzyme
VTQAPSRNRDTAAAWTYHNATKYVAVPNETGEEQFLMGTPPDVEDPIWQEDWSLEPLPFKIYETAPPLTLGSDFPAMPRTALEAIARTGAETARERVPDRGALARIGLLSNGLLGRQFVRSGGTVDFRTAGATGARYHLEIYFVCADLADLRAGIYHYAAHDHSLRQLRAGDYRSTLAAAAGDQPAVLRAPVVLAITSTFWRNAWRYKARAYRHTFWDAGTSLANVLAITAAADLPATLVMGYADGPVNALLGVDGRNEAAIVLCAIGHTSGGAPAAPDAPPLDLPTRPLSPGQVEFPHISLMHTASELTSGDEAAAWRAAPLRRAPREPEGPATPLRPMPHEQLSRASIDELVFSRRSTRRYATDSPVGFEAFSTLLDVSSRGFATDYLALDSPALHDHYLIVSGVDRLKAGVYLHHRRLGVVELLREGDFRRQAQRLAVEQEYAGDAHVNCYSLTDLDPVLERYGNRGYRLAQMECSLYSGKLHLAAHALGLGAVGSTSLDDEVTDFFSPHAAGKSYMFITVFGRRRARA